MQRRARIAVLVAMIALSLLGAVWMVPHVLLVPDMDMLVFVYFVAQMAWGIVLLGRN